jgi:hypothetical protein
MGSSSVRTTLTRVWRRDRAATFSQNQAAGEREMSIFTRIEHDKQIEI